MPEKIIPCLDRAGYPEHDYDWTNAKIVMKGPRNREFIEVVCRACGHVDSWLKKIYGALWRICPQCHEEWPRRRVVAEEEAKWVVEQAKRDPHGQQCTGCGLCAPATQFGWVWREYPPGQSGADLPGGWKWREKERARRTGAPVEGETDV